MKAVTLLYHDAVIPGHDDASGFTDPGAPIYKLEVEDMRRHFAAIAAARPDRPARVHELLSRSAQGSPVWLLTFDDGGASATLIADLLHEHGWIGHFFVTAGRIDTPGFVSSAQVRELALAGHVIGSHSWSHPTRMSSCNVGQLREEWQRSVGRLRDILGRDVDTASVPGGYFSHEVARTAAESGIRALFTSEPVKHIAVVDGCLVLGRYGLQRGMPPGSAAALCTDSLVPAQVRQKLLWDLKKGLKAVGGRYYPAGRQLVLRLRG